MAVGVAARQGQHSKRAHAGDGHARDQGQVEQQPQRDGPADQFGQGRGQNGGFARQPRGLGPTRGQMARGQRGQVLSGSQRQARHQYLKAQRQECRGDDDHQQAVAEAAAARDVCRPVARVDVAHGHQNARAHHAAQIRRHLGVLGQGGFAA
ncbi:hypothetical protein D3C87_1640490 [compost metagenome]